MIQLKMRHPDKVHSTYCWRYYEFLKTSSINKPENILNIKLRLIDQFNDIIEEVDSFTL